MRGPGRVSRGSGAVPKGLAAQSRVQGMLADWACTPTNSENLRA